MKILLIQPPAIVFKNEAKSCQPPLGLAYLAAVLRKDNDVRVIDCVAEGFDNESFEDQYLRYGLSRDEIKNRIVDAAPDMVGVSCLFSSAVQEALEICRIAKSANGSVVTVMGGAHPSAVPEEILKDPSVDYVVVGEGEDSMRGLVGHIKNGGGKEGFPRGVACRSDGGIKFTPNDKISDLDALPFPAWDLMPLARYFHIKRPHGGLPRKTPFFPVMTSRGCPYKCIFCSIHNLWGRKYRPRSASSVLAEMRHLKEAFGAKEIFFEDDNLTLDRARADKIFKGMISDRLNLIWSSPNGVAVSTIDHGLLGVIKKSGCRALSFGIESGDNYVLNNIINKPVDVSHAQDIIQEASRLGIETSVFFVVGFPDENRAQLANTIGLAERLRADSVNFFFATPLPGTEFFRRCMEKGLISPGADYRYLHSGKPHFDMVDVARGDLEKLIIKERIRISEMLLKRKPLLFVRKVFKKIVHDPMYFVRFFKKALVKSGGKGVG